MSEPDPKELAEQREMGRRFACQAAWLMEGARCEDVCVLDVREQCSVTDYFVVASGTSDRQIRAVSDQLRDLAKRWDQPISGVHGKGSCQWVVVDCVDVVLHLFLPAQRSHYDLESFWGDAPRIDWRAVEPTASRGSRG